MSRIHQFDKKIVIEQPTKTTTTHGDKETTGWATFATVWARRNVTNTRETFEAAQQVSKDFTEWVVRHIDGVTAQMRVNFDDQYYYIIGTKEKMRTQHELIIVTELRDNEPTLDS